MEPGTPRTDLSDLPVTGGAFRSSAMTVDSPNLLDLQIKTAIMEGRPHLAETFSADICG